MRGRTPVDPGSASTSVSASPTSKPRASAKGAPSRMPPGRACKRRNVGGGASPASAEMPAASNAESATKSVPPRRVNIASAWK